MVACHKARHADDADHRNADGRDGVSVEHFQCLDIRRDEGDEVAAVAALELGRGQAAQRTEHLIPDEGQQLERNIVVGSLLRIAQDAAQQGKHQNAGKGRADRAHRACQPQRTQDAEPAENGNEGGAEMPRHAHDDSRQHDGQHRLDQHDEPPHKDKGAAVFRLMHQASSFPNCSSSFWARYRRLYTPCRASSSAWVPCPAIRPLSST